MPTTHFIEATHGPNGNWGKFMLQKFTPEEWALRSEVDQASSLIGGRGWSPQHVFITDLQTGEGAFFLPTPNGSPTADLQKHAIWVCPLFQAFLEWLYVQPRESVDGLPRLPRLVTLPDAPFAMVGYRRNGPPPEPFRLLRYAVGHPDTDDELEMGFVLFPLDDRKPFVMQRIHPSHHFERDTPAIFVSMKPGNDAPNMRFEFASWSNMDLAQVEQVERVTTVARALGAAFRVEPAMTLEQAVSGIRETFGVEAIGAETAHFARNS